jgi:hypothetical protein
MKLGSFGFSHLSHFGYLYSLSWWRPEGRQRRMRAGPSSAVGICHECSDGQV